MNSDKSDSQVTNHYSQVTSLKSKSKSNIIPTVMKKILSLLTLILCCVGFAFAKPVGIDQARKAALNYLKKANPSYANLSMESLVDITSTTSYREFYVFSINREGFILVSGDDCAVPILGYSATSIFENERIPENVRVWLNDYEKQIAWLRTQNIKSGNDLEQKWRQLLEDRGRDVTVVVEPLITTTWSQMAYYNAACPYDASAPTSCNGHVPAGCVSVAVGQILKHYRWPSIVYATHAYTHPTYGTLTADFSSICYQYYSMPDALSSSSTPAEVDAVSTLLYHIGVALETDYGPNTSSAYLYASDTNIPSAYKLLKYLFGYPDVNYQLKSNYSNDGWINNVLKIEIWNNRPVLYSGSTTNNGSHVFILDGYNSDNQFHVNWGWGGQCDGYYTIGSLNPYSGAEYNSNNYALVGITPPSHQFTVSVNPPGAGVVTGTTDGIYLSGYEYVMNAQPAEGYRLLNVTYNGEDQEYIEGTRFTLNEDVNLTYNFAPIGADEFYYCTFNPEDTAGWVLVNDNQVNKWYIGDATSSDWFGSSLYVSSDNGESQSYDINERSIVWAYREMTVPAGNYFVQYYWNGIGEGEWDYMRVFLVPTTATLTAGSLPDDIFQLNQFTDYMPEGWISLCGENKLNLYTGSGWSKFSDEIVVPESGDYKMAILWANDGSVGSQPPANIDRITFRPATGNITLIAQQDTVDFTVYGGEITGAGRYYYGGTCTVHAVPNHKTRFRGWYDRDGLVVSYAPTYSFTVTGDDTLYARFTYNTSYYSCTFSDNDSADWVLVNGDQINKWCFGTAATLNPTHYGLYISNDNGVSNAYTTNTRSIVYAYRREPLIAGDFHFSCAWKANGESNYDYMRIFIAPVEDLLTAGVFPDNTTSCYNFRETIPEGWTQVGPTPYFNGADEWTHYSTDIHVVNSIDYRLVFLWCNDNGGGSQPPAAVGNIVIEPFEYTVSASVYPANTGTVHDTGTYPSGYNCTLTAASAPGYRFAGWRNSMWNVIESTDSVYSFPVWGDKNLVAIFEPADPMDYWCYFGTTGQDDTTGWVLVNDGQTNKWCIGDATSADNHRSLYISNDNGVSNSYSTNKTSISWAYREFDLIAGIYEVSYMWKAKGEDNYDWLKVFLAPGDATLTAGRFHDGHSYSSHYRDTVPAGWINLCGKNKLNLQSEWQYYFGEVELEAGRYKLVFLWANDGGGGAQPPAAVDQIHLKLPACRRATGVDVHNVTDNSLDVTWNANDIATSWYVDVNLPNNAGSAFHTVATTPSCHITGLNPNSDYVLAITPICSSSSTGQSLQIPVHTECVPMSLPYMQDFEDEPVGNNSESSFIPCWHRLNNATTFIGYPYVGDYSRCNHTSGGSKGLSWYCTSSSTDAYGDYQMAVLPRIDVNNYPINTLQLTFWASCGSSSHDPVIQVGVMSDPNDPDDFETIHTVYVNQDMAWHEYRVSLEDYIGSGIYVALRSESIDDYHWYVYLDDITLDQIPDCPRVESITTRNTAPGTVDLSWIEQGVATSWIVKYLPEGGLSTDTVVLSAYNNYLTLTGLEPNTTYTVWITPDCYGTAETNQATFHTLCTFLESLPYTMGFETSEGVSTGQHYDSPDFVECWHRLNNGGYYNGYPHVSSSYNHTVNGSQGLYWYYSRLDDQAVYGDYQVAVLPGVNTTIYSVNTLQISFWIRTQCTNGFTPTLQVGVMTDPYDITTFTSVSTLSLNNDDLWHDYIIPLDDYRGGGAFVAVRADRVESNDYVFVYIDDITLEEIPDCRRVENLTAQGTGTTTADLSWIEQGLATSWIVKYLPSGGSASDTVTLTVSSSHPTLTGLQPSTDYTVWITPVCSGTAGTNSTSFRTFCDAIETLPYTMGFEESEDVASGTSSPSSPFTVVCWHRLNNDDYLVYPYVYNGSSYSHTGDHDLYWYFNDDGTHPSDYYMAVALPSVNTQIYPVNTLQLSFWAKSPSRNNPIFLAGVMTDPDDISTFVFADSVVLIGDNSWHEYTVSFEGYTGSGTFVALNLVKLANDIINVDMDDITLAVNPNACGAITFADLPYTENFDGYTTSTTAATGVEPTCWSLVQEDVAMTGANRPQLYYKSSYAHSGSYSLLLNYRGVYAMPELSQESQFKLNRVKLEMYLRQPKAYYQLQVGVWEDNGTFVPVATFNNSGTDVEYVECDFSGYNGSGHRIAFRNVLADGYSYNYSYNYIDDITLTDNCEPITLPYMESFDDYTTSTTVSTGAEPTCWSLVQEDVAMTDANRPQLCYKSSYAHSGSYSLLLNYRGVYAMPELSQESQIPLNQVKLEMYLRQPKAYYLLQVGVWEDDGTFVPVATFNNSGTGVEFVECDFSSYRGSGRRIAFRNVLADGYSYNYSYNYIDDITLTDNCEPITLPYAEDFDGYTTSTTAATGEEPTCWNLVQEDVVMTAANRPQLYYKSSYAHSGSYSLLLNYRGVYAMPELSQESEILLNQLKLEMYLRQPKAYYQLQVGVWEEDGTFVPVATFNNSSTDVELVECDFSSYTGSGRRIAFRNVLASGYSYNYSYNYIDDITLTEIPQTDCAISLPYSENFDDYTTSTTVETGVQPDCWEVISEDVALTDATKPQLYRGYASSGSYSLRMKNRCVYAMPALDEDVDISELTMTMRLRQPKSVYRLQVGVVDNEGTFKLVKTINNTSTSTEDVTVNFANYTGSGHRIAFRNTLVSGSTLDYSINYLDNITLDYTPAPCGISELPYTEYFDSYTTSTTPETGVQPRCWEVVAEDVALTDATKPQVYYNSTYASSGSYSLRLKNRCVYAMPELDENVNVNDLTMTMKLRQPKAIYRLQVGVLDSQGTFKLVKTINNTSTGIEDVTVSFANYTAGGHRIAFRNTLGSGSTLDYSINYIDNINLSRTTGKSIEVTAADADDAGMMGAGRDMLDVMLYPNPTKDYVNVQCSMDNVQCTGVEVIDLYGKVVRTVVGANNDSATQINVSGLAAGMYFVRVTTDRGTVTKPFVKK